MMSAKQAANLTINHNIKDVMHEIEKKILKECTLGSFDCIWNHCGDHRDVIVYRLRSMGYYVEKFGKKSIRIFWNKEEDRTS